MPKTARLPMVAPPGGLTRTVGTNLFASDIPAGRYPPIVFDIATSGATESSR